MLWARLASTRPGICIGAQRARPLPDRPARRRLPRPVTGPQMPARRRRNKSPCIASAMPASRACALPCRQTGRISCHLPGAPAGRTDTLNTGAHQPPQKDDRNSPLRKESGTRRISPNTMFYIIFLMWQSLTLPFGDFIFYLPLLLAALRN